MRNVLPKDSRCDFTNVANNAARFRTCRRGITRGKPFSAIHQCESQDFYVSFRRLFATRVTRRWHQRGRNGISANAGYV
jgi:hypothetical protein